MSERPHCSKPGCPYRQQPGRRGLCYSCYTDPAVRPLYRSASTKANRGFPDANRNKEPTTPTIAPAGSLAKMRVMKGRLLRGENLNHPQDNLHVDEKLIGPFDNVGRYRSGEDTGVYAVDSDAELPVSILLKFMYTVASPKSVTLDDLAPKRKAA